MHPDYRRYLPALAAALRPVLDEVAGLPGAPVRITQIAGMYSSSEGEATEAVTIGGRPPVLGVPLDAENPPGAFGGTMAHFADQLRLLFVHAFVGAGQGAGTPAQQAVQAAMLQAARVPIAVQPNVLAFYGLPSWARAAGRGPGPGPARGPVYAAARRLAAMPAAVRHNWLAAHLGVLRSGRLTLAQLT